MRTSNPVLTTDTFRFSRSEAYGMTVPGVVYKTALLLVLTFLSSTWIWLKFVNSGGNIAQVNGFLWGGLIAGFVLGMATAMKKDWAPITAPIYALCQGLFLGAISAVMEAAYPGIVLQASTLTFGTLAAMLFVYQAGIIRPTQTFKMIVMSATGGIAIVYLAGIVLSFFGVNMSFLYGNGLFSILFSLFVVGIAALNFVIDFDFIEQGAARGAPKFMEWYGAFALLVTMIWLYIEFLRLLSKLRSRN